MHEKTCLTPIVLPVAFFYHSNRMKTDSDDYVLSVNSANVRIQEKLILKDISLTASSGKIMAILGPTGTVLSFSSHIHPS